MKVAMIGHKVVPSRRGGIEKVLTSLCPLLVEAGAEVVCYNRSSDKVENEYVGTVVNKKYCGVTLKTAWTVESRGLSAMIASFTAAICATFSRYDVVHFHAEGPCAAMWIPKLFGKRCVATVHGLDWQREKWGKGFASKYIKFGERVMVRCADEIIVLSESARAYFEETYHRKTVLIHNGIEQPVKKEAEKITQLYGLAKDEYICMVCRLTAEKGVHYLIDAYNRIKTDKKLVIAGGSSDTDSFLEEIQEMAASDARIRFTGFVQGKLLEELYSNAYLYVLPSDLEGMPLSLLEAMSYGNCCLVSDIPECADVVEDKALTFRKSDENDLKEKLQYICDHQDIAAKYKAQAADFICEKYSWDAVVQETLALYR